MTNVIPKRIIQTGKTTDLSLLAKACIANLRLLNPDFDYLFFDDAKVEEFIDVEFPQYRGIFDSFPVRIQRYDFFRYLAIYQFGGFYFDTDVLLARSLEELPDSNCVFSFEYLSNYSFLRKEYGMDWEIGNYAFGATPRHPFLGAVIQNCIRAQQDPEWAEAMLKSVPRMFRDDALVLVTTGPGLVSRTLAEYSGACEQVEILFPEDVCDPSSWFRFGTYGVHLQVGGWRKRHGLVHRALYRAWESTRRQALLEDSLKRGGKRSLEFKRSPLPLSPPGLISACQAW